MNKSKSITGFIKTAALAGGVLLAAKGLDNRIEVTHYTISGPKIPPEFEGFKILQISDYHCDTVPGLIEEIRSQSPDIIVSTGDLVHDKGSYEPGIQLVKKLLEIAPCYMVTGNHDVWRSDYSELERYLDRTGAVTLHDKTLYLVRNGARIALSGIDDPFTRDSAAVAKRVKASLSRVPVNRQLFNILLFHRANLSDMLKDKGFDLILAGHMHGGQFRLPWVGGVVSPKSSLASGSPMLFPKYVGGRYRSCSTEIIVNRGIGNPMIIPRVFNRPELVVVTLRPGGKSLETYKDIGNV